MRDCKLCATFNAIRQIYLQKGEFIRTFDIFAEIYTLIKYQ